MFFKRQRFLPSENSLRFKSVINLFPLPTWLQSYPAAAFRTTQGVMEPSYLLSGGYDLTCFSRM